MTLSPTPIRLGILGQSLVEAMLRDPLKTQVLNGLKQRFSRVTMNGWAVMGSVSDKSHRPDENRYWWDLEGNAIGPCMRDWLARITPLAVTDRPNILLINLGEGDSAFGTEYDASIYERAMRKIIAYARNYCNPTSPDSVLVLMYVIGRRILNAAVPGVQAVREAQYRLLFGPKAIPNCYHLASIWDVELIGEVEPESYDSHPTVAGYTEFGRRVVDRISWIRGGLGGHMALRAISARQTAPDALAIEIGSSTASEIRTPADYPYGVALRSGADTWTGAELQYGWETLAGAKRRLTVTAPRPITGKPMLLYPYGQLMDLDRGRMITDQLGEPVEPFSFEVDAPLVTDADAASAVAAIGSSNQLLYKLALGAGLIPPIDKGS